MVTSLLNLCKRFTNMHYSKIQPYILENYGKQEEHQVSGVATVIGMYMRFFRTNFAFDVGN